MLTKEQKELRKTGIGGSDAAAIAGKSHWKTPHDVYLEKLGFDEKEDREFLEYLYIGSKLEPIAADLYAERTGNKVRKVNKMLRHKKYPWMIANIDRMVIGQNRIVECKTANYFIFLKYWGDSGTDDIPDEYLFQCAHYVAVCDAEACDIAVLIGNHAFKVYTYHRNQRFENKLIQAEHDFWHNHVLKREAPYPLTSKEANSIWQENPEKAVLADQITIENLERLSLLKQKIKAFEEEKDSIELSIKSKLKDGSVLTNEYGLILASWKERITNRFDTDAFKQKHTDLYRQFLKQQTTRYFLLKEVNNG